MTGNERLTALFGAPNSNYASRNPTPTLNTPSTSTSPQSGLASRTPSPSNSGSDAAYKARRSPPPRTSRTPLHKTQAPNWIPPDAGSPDSDPEEEGEGMVDARAPSHRPTDGTSHVPLLKGEHGRSSYDAPVNGAARPSRSSTFQSRSPDMDGSSSVKKKYTYAGFFLLLSLISFVVQTETAVYIQHELGWNKAYAML